MYGHLHVLEYVHGVAPQAVEPQHCAAVALAYGRIDVARWLLCVYSEDVVVLNMIAQRRNALCDASTKPVSLLAGFCVYFAWTANERNECK